MRMQKHLRWVVPVAAATGLFLAPRDAGATACTALSATIPIVVIENGDTQEPLVKRLGKALVNSATPLRIVYKNRRTCDLAADFFSGTPVKNDSIVISYIPTATEDPAWDPKKPTPTCTADDAGNPIDLAIGATFLSSCANLPPKPADVAVQDGPVQSYGYIVPTASSQVAMTAEEGYFAFGFPNETGMAAPWVDQNLRFVRGPTASTALTLAAAIGLKATQLRGTVVGKNTSDELLAAVVASTDPEKTIGFLGTEVYDAKGRGNVKLLAFKGFKQRYAYYPDSTAATFDKQNVRDGHYLPWAPTPYIAKVDGGGKIANANAQRIVDLVFGTKSEPGVDGLEQVIASGLIPQCAMKVKRDFDGSDLALYSAPEPCGCYFESKVPQGATKCTVCTDDTPCGGGKCRRGYCEAR